jgi:CBS domain containing-hemolysin-like protein
MAVYLEPPVARYAEGALGLEGGAAALFVLAVQTVIATGVVLVFGEILPKSLFRNPRETLVFAIAIPLKLTYYLFSPLIWLASATSQLLLKLFGAEAETFTQFMRHDFEVVIRESRESGTLDLDDEGSEILANVLELGNLRVKDTMVPRTEVAGLEVGSTLEEVRERFVETGYSRLPIYRDNIDQIVGVVVALDLFHRPESLAAVTRTVMVVPEAKPARDLLRELLAERQSIAVVVDEYGGTAGVVTVEDLLEELFGEIQDEFDAEEPGVLRLDDGALLATGRTEVEHLNETYDLSLPEGDYDTLGGLVVEQLAEIPEPGAELDVEGYRLTVIAASANRIDQVRIETRPENEEPEAQP